MRLSIGSHPKRVLIVEDDKDMQSIYAHMLGGEKTRYEIRIVDDPLSALKLIHEEAFDAVITDMIMRSMTGEAFIAHLRKDGKHPLVPVLVVTVLGQEMLESFKGMSRVYFLQKPVTRDKLLGKIRAITAGRKGGAR